MRRRGIRTAVIVAMGLLLAPALAVAAPGHRWGGGGSRGAGPHAWGGPRWHNWSGRGHGHWHGSGWSFGVGIGVGALLTAPWWAYPPVYAAPAYPVYPPYSPYPAYPAYPAAGYPGSYGPPPSYPAPPPPPGPPGPVGPSSLVPTPEPLSAGSPPSPDPSGVATPSGPEAASAASPPAGCETVTVAGHWEMRVYPDGRRMTFWVPTVVRSVCPR